MLCFFNICVDLVVASAGDDKKISLRRKNGQGLWTVPAKTDSGESIEVNFLSELQSRLEFLGRVCFNASFSSLNQV